MVIIKSELGDLPNLKILEKRKEEFLRWHKIADEIELISSPKGIFGNKCPKCNSTLEKISGTSHYFTLNYNYIDWFHVLKCKCGYIYVTRTIWAPRCYEMDRRKHGFIFPVSY